MEREGRWGIGVTGALVTPFPVAGGAGACDAISTSDVFLRAAIMRAFRFRTQCTIPITTTSMMAMGISVIIRIAYFCGRSEGRTGLIVGASSNMGVMGIVEGVGVAVVGDMVAFVCVGLRWERGY